MPRLSCNQLSTYKWSLDEDLCYYHRAGFEAVGIWRRKLIDFGVERGLELIHDSGLTVSNMTWAGGFTGIDGRTFDESVQDAREAIRLAARASAGCLVVFSGGRNGHTSRHAERLLRSALEMTLPLAEAMGVTLVIKPVHPACAAEWSILTSIDEAAQLIREYDSSRLRMAFDTYHFPLRGPGLGLLGEVATLIGLVQLADARTPHGVDQDRCPLGEGAVPVREMLHALLDAGYTGYFDVEIMGPSVETIDYARLLDQTRQAYDAMLLAADRRTALAAPHSA